MPSTVSFPSLGNISPQTSRMKVVLPAPSGPINAVSFPLGISILISVRASVVFFDDLEKKITPKTKILALCSPHNPVGRVWSKEELERLADICIKHNIVIVSDEIHSDLTFKKFIPLASISNKIANQTITLNSAGKTFNIAGLNCAYGISKNSDLLEKFKKVSIKREIHSINFFGYISTRAAYENGEIFVKELKNYIM